MFTILKKNEIPQCSGIVVQASPIHGLGVFAKKSFKKGAIIEIAPLIVLPEIERELLKTTLLFNYYFLVETQPITVALGLGYSSIYNHHNSANAAYTIHLNGKKLIIKACKIIGKGEEITLNYNGVYDDATPVYFDKHI